jgi:hypothetical protein
VTVSLSVAMMAHPKRRELAESIRAKLDRDVPVIWDERDSRWDTGRRAMLAYDPGCTHHAVIQDDVLVCRDLFAGLTTALEYVPDNVAVCGYVGRVRPLAEMVTRAAHEARRLGASWLTMHTLNWGPLIAVPTAVIPDMIRHCDGLRNIPNYDRRLSRFFELKLGVPTYYTWPSLVDHADGPSLVPGRIGTDRSHARHQRVAHTFIGEDASALDVDWTGRVVNAEGELTLSDLVYRHVRTGQELHLSVTSPRVRRLRGSKSWELVRGTP